MLNVADSSVTQDSRGWFPVKTVDGIEVMSIGFLLPNKDDAVVWRGPKKQAMIKQFLTDVQWSKGGQLDYLLIDTPPGTSDEHLAIVEQLKSQITGAVVVTTPQQVGK